MSNPTLITVGFQKHVNAQAAFRANTFMEEAERIVGSSARLRGLEFVSENAGVDVTLSAGDFISSGHVLDASKPTRTSGIISRLVTPVTIDVAGFTDPIIYGFVDNAIEDIANPIKFYVTENAAPPDSRYAPIIFKFSGIWTSYNAVGNDELIASSILASGTATIPSGVDNPTTITHNLNMASYKVLLQPYSLNVPTYTLNGLNTSVQTGEIWPENLLTNTFDVNSDGNASVTFYWAVIS